MDLDGPPSPLSASPGDPPRASIAPPVTDWAEWGRSILTSIFGNEREPKEASSDGDETAFIKNNNNKSGSGKPRRSRRNPTGNDGDDDPSAGIELGDPTGTPPEAEDETTEAEREAYTALHATIKRLFHDVPLSPLQMLAAMAVVKKMQEKHTEATGGAMHGTEPVTSVSRVGYLARVLNFCLATYGWKYATYANSHGARTTLHVASRPTQLEGNMAALFAFTKVSPGDVLMHQWSSSVYRPAFFLAVDRVTETVVLAIRGSMSLEDAMTDIVSEGEAFRPAEEPGAAAAAINAAAGNGTRDNDNDNDSDNDNDNDNDRGNVTDKGKGKRRDDGGNQDRESGGDDDGAASETIKTPTNPKLDNIYLAHKGMLKAARWFVEEGVVAAMQLAVEREGFRPVVTGHSLGAGVAVLVGLLARDVLPEVRVVGFGTPCVVSHNLGYSPWSRSHITTVIHGHDIVPRLSVGSVERFTHVAQRLCTDGNIYARLFVGGDGDDSIALSHDHTAHREGCDTCVSTAHTGAPQTAAANPPACGGKQAKAVKSSAPEGGDSKKDASSGGGGRGGGNGDDHSGDATLSPMSTLSRMPRTRVRGASSTSSASSSVSSSVSSSSSSASSISSSTSISSSSTSSSSASSSLSLSSSTSTSTSTAASNKRRGKGVAVTPVEGPPRTVAPRDPLYIGCPEPDTLLPAGKLLQITRVEVPGSRSITNMFLGRSIAEMRCELPEHYNSIRLDGSPVFDHFPDSYESGIKLVLDTLRERQQELKAKSQTQPASPSRPTQG